MNQSPVLLRYCIRDICRIHISCYLSLMQSILGSGCRYCKPEVVILLFRWDGSRDMIYTYICILKLPEAIPLDISDNGKWKLQEFIYV